MPEAPPPAPIAFIDLDAQRRAIGPAMEEAVLKVVRSGRYILGPEVAELETALARYASVPFALSCANGTDALALALMAWDIRPGDAVLVPAFTFAATAEVVVWFGATPVFVDVREDTFNMDPASLEAGIETAKRLGLVPRAMIPVDLFGQPADYARLLPIARRHGLKVLVDAAQSFGATWNGTHVAATGDMAATSFFPAKPLGCYGDGGAVFCHDRETLELLLSLRVHGQSKDDKYENVRVGMNGRLDTVQAAVLLQKLAVFESECAARQRIADRYNAALADVAIVPRLAPGNTSVWAQYTLRIPGHDRARVLAALKAEGIPTAIYYPKPLHRQTAYAHHPVAGNGLPVSERLAAEVFSLPFHPYLEEATQDRIIAATRRALGA
ncbi:DegT/DnrJ/EryC1/StrS family aminotransferase [Elioraea sp. Yellowstone]|jgi:dTDP-4-amino-4,6-dideoxygalactose transaminase|uniref:DegT/DnrJ/EryC1/StrS family aminotransferase n=1 Tax=Elioraea sp. Yellowstone TaxID=2592070 RepID=UPI0011501271|nr:DegT/DnrJ/EryC1/StrS family aminotransferase [Elioraea sp. Yellowstone]TQF83681.1 DegT/DnrJ/EryC1/StrS family aminotransferase [Elioraea sp. Yellowstone]